MRRTLIYGFLSTCLSSAAAYAQDAQAQNSQIQDANVAMPAKTFDLMEYAVDGNTVLPEIEIEKAVYPFLGPGRTGGDIEKARAALEDAYKAHGFQTVQVVVPEQDMRDGTVHLQVSEGRVGRLRVVNSQYHAPSEIKADAPSMIEGTVPDFNQIQRDIVNLNQWPDRKVTPTLKAGIEPDTVDVDLQVEDQLPLHASLELNNQRSVGTTSLRAIGTASYDNLWQLGHSISLTYQVAPQNPNDTQVFSGTYTWRVKDSPWSILLDGVKTDSNVSTVGATDVVGKGGQIGVHALLALPGTEKFNQSLTAAIYYKDFQNVTSLGSNSTDTPVTYFPITVSYAATLQEDKAVDQGTLALTFAFPPTGSSTTAFDNDRFSARGQQFYVRGGLNRTQQLPGGLELYGHVDGQITDQPLITNEQFSAGGYNSVRGYLEAEELGDIGAHGGVELRSPSIVDWLDLKDVDVDELRFILFAEGAHLWLNEPLAEQRSQFGLASVGAGASAKLLEHLNGAVDLAVPVLAASSTKAGSRQILFRVWTEY
ncbi:MAG TPA: POTRA domain-containing protein [Aliidongia sp.]|nr:POTRA domain-containing protein [Aliidongia sp.]